MSALEQEIQEIVARIRLLDKESRQRVIQAVQEEVSTKPPFDFAAWQGEASRLREEIRAELPEGDAIDVVALLRELREERS